MRSDGVAGGLRLGRGLRSSSAALRAKAGGSPLGARIAPGAGPEETRLTVEVRPRAGRNEVRIVGEGTVRVWVTAPPADGAANAAVRSLLAEALRCPRAAVEVVRGHAARTKRVRVAGLASDEVTARLRERA
jgi:uncharacterized protein (TIGR00251 family)